MDPYSINVMFGVVLASCAGLLALTFILPPLFGFMSKITDDVEQRTKYTQVEKPIKKPKVAPIQHKPQPKIAPLPKDDMFDLPDFTDMDLAGTGNIAFDEFEPVVRTTTVESWTVVKR